MSALFLSFNHQKTVDACISTASEEVDTIFIAKAPISNHIMFLHHFTKLGGTRTNPDEKHFVLVGTGSSAYPAQTNKESCFGSSAGHPVSTWANVTALTDAASISTLTTRANSAQKVFRNCFPLPPFIATALMASDQSIPEMIITTIAKIRAFDEEHAEDGTFEKANEHCKMLVWWLIAAQTDGVITPIPLVPSVDPLIKEACHHIHHSKIHTEDTVINPSNTDNSQAFDQLANNVSAQTSVLQKMNILAEEKGSLKKKGFSSLHPSTQKMILAASSKNGTDCPESPVATCIEFFSQKSAVHAKIHLAQTLKSTYRCVVDIKVPLATALYHGNFLWDRPDTPNNLCTLLLGKPLPLSSTGAKEAMVLHLKAEKGAGWSDKELNTILNQVIIVPDEVDKMIHNIHNTAAVSEIMHGTDSILTTGLKSWRFEISSNLIIYEAHAANDKTFIARVLVAIDTRVNCWLNECMSKDLRCNVDDALVDFEDMQRAIKIGSFSFTLPSSIRSHISKDERTRFDDEDKDDEGAKRTTVTNPNRVPAWKLREGEDYKDVFASKHLDRRPKLDGVTCCPRWHIKGICFSNCNLRSTHVKLTSQPKAGMVTYCRTCRDDAPRDR